jgi:cytochrome c oxidase subunit 4
MTDSHHDAAHSAKVFRAYMVVAIVLAVFTATSFGVNYFVRHEHISPSMGFLLILGVAICKACLVGMYFMHLMWDWGKLYFIIVPIFILGTMMAIVFLPDAVFAWHPDLPGVLEPPVSTTGTR